ncbi:unnamed protein product [Merluccius merluccius]
MTLLEIQAIMTPGSEFYVTYDLYIAAFVGAGIALLALVSLTRLVVRPSSPWQPPIISTATSHLLCLRLLWECLLTCGGCEVADWRRDTR